jgi:uncharacterized protein YycO
MIALYKGKSIISRIIKSFTWSQYSHAAWIDDDGSVYEAWHRGGVTHVNSISANHTPGTLVHIYKVTNETPEIRQAVRIFLQSQVGLKYDWLGVFGFVLRAHRFARQNRWFCSELVAEAYRLSGHKILNLPSNKVFPGMLAASLTLTLEKETVTV